VNELLSTEVEHSSIGTIYVFRTSDDVVVGWWRKPVAVKEHMTIGAHLSLLTPTQRFWLAIAFIFSLVASHYGLLVNSILAVFWIGGMLAMLAPDWDRSKKSAK
jgi:hypothetical protein